MRLPAFRSVIAAALLLTSVLPAWPARADGPSLPPMTPTAPTEVVIIGTQHSSQLVSDRATPAQMRAVLNRIAPEAVGIETPPEWYAAGVQFEITYESYGIAVPWATEHGKQIRPIDWQGGNELMAAFYWPQQSAHPKATAEPLLPSIAGPFDADPKKPLDLLFADTAEWTNTVLHNYYDSRHESPAAEGERRYMSWRNLQIARLVVNMATEYPGKRVAVIIGAAHKPDLDALLANVPNIVVRQASEFGEPTAAEIEKETRKNDQLATLWFNLAGRRADQFPKLVDLSRMESLLKSVEATSPDDPEVRFLRAMWYKLNGQMDKSVTLLQTLAWDANWSDRTFTYPNHQIAENAQTYFAQQTPGYRYKQLPVGGVLSPVSNLTIRQRVLYELAQQKQDSTAAKHALIDLLLKANLNPTQLEQMQTMLQK